MRYIPTRLLLVLLMCCLWLPLQAAPYSYARPLPSPLDMFEAGMYWLRDWTGPENPEDPASLFTLMEEQASRSFDFAGMATVIAGPEYWAGNILKRSHFQRDLRDWLFLQLAREGDYSADARYVTGRSCQGGSGPTSISPAWTCGSRAGRGHEYCSISAGLRVAGASRM